MSYSLLKSCAKIGEGVYGEVFRAQYENGQSIALKVFVDKNLFLPDVVITLCTHCLPLWLLKFYNYCQMERVFAFNGQLGGRWKWRV